MGEPSVQGPSGETPLGPKLPLKLGRFTLCEELGAGGMATVYLARMELAAGIERLVALKTIHPHLAKEPPFVDMFLDEARIASHVTHPNVCSTHDFGEVDGVYYLAMEYLLGEPLFDVINRLVERFDDIQEVLPYLAARIIADACEGLHAAHTSRGPGGERLHIVHRDVSPQNLFMTYDGSVKVVDFGCAKAAERVAHTSTGVMKGKVGYAAPEQLKSDRSVDARADVWALGVCLWETLTLSPLFTRDTAVSTAMSVLQDDIERADDGRDWVPKEIADIVERCLERDKEKRFDSARDLGRALRHFIANSGYTLESAELAEWMDFLFEEQHDERAAMAKRVREMDLSEVSRGPLYEVTASDVELLDAAPVPLEAEPYDSDEDMAFGGVVEASGPIARSARASIESPEGGAPPKKKRSRLWLWATIAVLLLGGLYWVQLYYEPAPWVLEVLGVETDDAAPRSEGTSEGRGESDEAAAGEAQAAEAQAAQAQAAEAQAAQAQAAEAQAAEAQAAEAQTAQAQAAEAQAAEAQAAEAQAAEAQAAEAQAEADTSGRGAGNDGASDGRRGASRSGRSGRRGGSTTTVVSGGGTTTYGTQTGSDTGGGSTTPTPRAATGGVSISAHGGGWADVFVGGRRLGRTPVRTELPEGRHRLRILPFGHEPGETVTVNIEAGLEETLVLELTDPGQ
ncbi:MAG: hypothetical protein SangKO_035790 [Sandaracinaceae bacterium]